MRKSDDFSAWYNDVIEKAGLIDKRYPVKGMDVWLPYGLKAMRLIDSIVREEMDRTGHEEVEFPLLIPKTEFQKEAEQIRGFGGEVYWVTHGGETELDIPLVVRPTSETAMYPMFALWIRSHKDLPLKIYQIVSVFRYETKQTRSLMRVREIHFFEAHTAHVDFEDAERQIHEDLSIWARVAHDLALPYLLHRRPDWDKFPGADYSLGADALLPELKTLQVATFHHYRENFSRAYAIQYEDPSGEHRFVHQTTYGMSERLLGALVALHGDDRGLVFPPAVAPLQVVLVPILFKGKEGPVLDSCRKALQTLRESGIRAHLDEREETAGFKFHDWELKGVPLRVEIGPRDVERGTVTLVRRDTLERLEVPKKDLVEHVRRSLEGCSHSLRKKARELLASNVSSTTTLEEAKERTGVVRIPWCGSEGCGKALEEGTGKKVLGVPFAAPEGTFERGEPPWEPPSFSGSCPICGQSSTLVVDLAKTY